MDERFSRINMLLGDEVLTRLNASTVTVIGVGAVGGQVIETLARSGIGHLRVVDFDIVRRTNINRQILALESTLGMSKVELATKRILDINPDCQVDTLKTFVAEETLAEVLTSKDQIVVDAIDSLNPKSKLIAELIKQQIPFIASMGAARLKDPNKIKIGHFSEATRCPLAHMVRRRLRNLGYDTTKNPQYDFICAYSDEGPTRDPESILPPEDDYFKRGRDRRPLGSLPVITSFFGLLIAHQVIKMIGKF